MIEVELIMKTETTRSRPLPTSERFVQYDETDRWWLEALGFLPTEQVLQTVVIPKARINNFESRASHAKVDHGATLEYVRTGRAIHSFTVEYETDPDYPVRMIYTPS